MAYPTTASLIIEKNKREGSYPIYLYVVEIATGSYLYLTNNNKAVTFYIPGSNIPQEYVPMNITHDRVETNTKGEIGDVQLTIDNVSRYIISLLLNADALRGKKVSILLVFSDALGDPDNYYLDEYFIDSSTVTETAAVFTLKSKFVINALVVPSRLYKRDQCPWSFKGVECAFKDGYKIETKEVRVVTATVLHVVIPSYAAANLRYPAGAILKTTHWTDNTHSSVTTASNVCTGSSYVDSNTLAVSVTNPIAENFVFLYYPSVDVTSTNVCKKTFEHCTKLCNQNRYGGFPSIPTRNIYF